MKLIKLTSLNNGSDIYINIDHIGHIYGETPQCTVIGVTTHNNGGFKVKETIKQILKLIEGTRAI